MRFRTATAFLEHASTLDVLTHTVPTALPIEHEAPPPILNQSDHALYSQTYFPSSSSAAGFILSRIIEDGFTLELRWVNSHLAPDSQFELDQHPQTLAPVRFTFPARLVPTPAFNWIDNDDNDDDDRESRLEILAVTEAGNLYALTFAQPSLFYQLDPDAHTWSEEFPVQHLEHRTPVLTHGREEGSLVIAAADGSNVVVEIAQDGALIETELKSPSSFSIRSLVPSFSRRDPTHSPARPALSNVAHSSNSTGSPLRLVSSHANSSASQLVSLAISTPSPSTSAASTAPTGFASFAFGVSRDRKLKVWNLDSGACLRSIDLPQTSTSTSKQVALPPVDSASQSQSLLLLPPTPQAFVKITTTTSTVNPQDELSFLTLYSPETFAHHSRSSFFVYSLAKDPHTGEISQLAPVAERVAFSSSSGTEGQDEDQGRSQLVDFELKKMTLDGADKWCLWTCWESAGQTRVRVSRLRQLEDQSDDVDEVEGDEWTVVETETRPRSAWTAAYFEQQLEANSGLTVPELFLRHISIPGRYPPASFDYALDMYEQVVLAEQSHSHHDVAPACFEQEYESNLIRTAAIVGSQVELTHSAQTGAPLVDDYNKRLKLEWLRFVTLLNESTSSALFPNCIAIDEPRGVAFVVGRDSVIVPVREQVVETLDRYIESSNPSSLSNVFPRYPQSNFVHLLHLIRSLRSKLSLKELSRFEHAVVDRITTPFTTDLADISLDLFEHTLERALSQETLDALVEGLKALIEPSQTIELFCQLLLDPAVEDRTRDIPLEGKVHASDFGRAVLTDLVSTNLEARYELAKGVVLLLVASWGASENSSTTIGDVDEDAGRGTAGVPPMATFEQTTSFAYTTLHSIKTLVRVANTVDHPTFEQVELAVSNERQTGESEAWTERFGRLGIDAPQGNDQAEVLPVPTYSLLNSLLRLPTYAPGLTSSEYLALPTSLTQALSTFYESTGLLTPKRLIDSNDSIAKFSDSLVQLGMHEQALELIKTFPENSGLVFVKGKALLELGQAELATTCFERAASGLFALESLAQEGAASHNGGLSAILPPKHLGSLSAYYVHLVSIFVPTGYDHSIAKFCQLALDALDDDDHDDRAELERTTEEDEKDLWTKLFRSWAAVGEYEKAYQAIMETPYHETKATCLAHFISLVCENGATSLLTTLSFVGLEGDLERNLSFRARNSDPLAQPDYYKVLYAWHVSKGDYKSAGTVMYQQARRIGEIALRGGSFRDLATVQCQSYLAAANALSLVKQEHAWVAIVADDNLERGNKRRKINYHIPDDEYDPNASRPLEMRRLVDIRREYTVALARLQLSAEFPELERTSFHLEPEAVVALFSQTNAFDQAFSAGRALDVDLSSLFEIVAEKCVGLTLHLESLEDASWIAMSPEASTWEGSLVTKAWKLLERHLQRHDSAPEYRYRLVVLERVLATNRDGKIPTFLTEFLLEHQPRALLRTLIRYDRLEEAFRYSLETIKKSSNHDEPLPFSIFDQLLAIPSGDSPHISDAVLKQQQQDLRQAVDDRIDKISKAAGAVTRM
ncbi:uncharacterized protein JCM15063_002619 [Sporobolomyces koalae]|uniref:uncharacterized protein n=1 Tax=Sporobolomyces koalae TaxID=500713 RepID=UPI0031730864